MNEVYALIYEANDVFEVDGFKVKSNPNFENILNRYKNNAYLQRVMSSVWCLCFFNVGDRDSMYNEMVNCGFRCFKINDPQITEETRETIQRKGEKQRRNYEKELKKLKRIAKREGIDWEDLI